MPAWAWWALAIFGGLLFVILVDYLYGRIILKWEHQIGTAPIPARPNNLNPRYKWVVFKGYSNPLDEFAEGMKKILDDPIVIADYGTCSNRELLFRSIVSRLYQVPGPHKLAIYGHSRGGQVGELFRQWYEAEGNPCGPICEAWYDCTPGDWLSLPGPMWMKRAMRRFFSFYKGGPILALLVAVINWYSRIAMPAPLDETVDRELFHRYRSKLMWYNSSRSVFELNSMLNYVMPKPQTTSTEMHYICAADPDRDKIVMQRVSVPQWLTVHPGMIIHASEAVGHAWPIEQPKAYREMLNAEASSNA